MSARGPKPLRPAPKRPWVMPAIVTAAALIVVAALIWAAVNGVLFALPSR